MNCPQCGEEYAWSDGVELVVNGDSLDFCSRGCSNDYIEDNDLITVVARMQPVGESNITPNTRNGRRA